MGLKPAFLILLFCLPGLAASGGCKGKPGVSLKDEKRAAARAEALRKANQESYDAALRQTALTPIAPEEITTLTHFGRSRLTDSFRTMVRKKGEKGDPVELSSQLFLIPGTVYEIISLEMRPGVDAAYERDIVWQKHKEFVYLGTHHLDFCSGPSPLRLHGALDAGAVAARDGEGKVWVVQPKPEWEYEKRLQGCLVDSGVRCGAVGPTSDRFLFLKDDAKWGGSREMPYKERIIEIKYEIVFR